MPTQQHKKIVLDSRTKAKLFFVGLCLVLLLLTLVFLSEGFGEYVSRFALGIPHQIVFAIVILFIISMTFALSNPSTAILVFLFIRPLMDLPKLFGFAGGAGINLGGAIGIALIFFGMFYFLMHRNLTLHRALILTYAIFWIWCIFASGTGEIYQVVSSIADVCRYLSYPILFILVVNVFKTEEQIKKLLLTLVLSGIPVLLGVLIINCVLHIYVGVHGGRVQGPFLHPNVLAYFMVRTIVLTIPVYFAVKKKKYKVLLLLYALLCLAVLLLTYTRGAWLIFIGIMMMYGAFRYRRFVLIIPVIVAIAWFSIPAVQDRMSDFLLTEKGSASSYLSRLRVHEALTGAFYEKPITGHGLRSSAYIAASVTEMYIIAHNDFLMLAVETGVIGLSLYIIVLLLKFKATLVFALRTKDRFRKDFAIIFLCFFIGMMAFSYQGNFITSPQSAWGFWTLYAVIFRLSVNMKLDNSAGAEARQVG